MNTKQHLEDGHLSTRKNFLSTYCAWLLIDYAIFFMLREYVLVELDVLGFFLTAKYSEVM